MTYVVDFEQSVDYNGWRYTLTRIAGNVSMRRQQLVEGTALGAPERIWAVEKLPDDLPLKRKFYTLAAGSLPAVA